MKVTAVARAQSVHSLPGSFFATVPVFDLVEAVKDRYAFRTAPSSQELLAPQPNQPANFFWGKGEINGRTITIESLQIVQFPAIASTVTVATRASTDDSDLVLDDLIGFVRSAFSLEPKAVFPRNYLSQLEFILDASLEKRLGFLKPVAELVTAYARGYGFTACPEYQANAFGLFFDNTKLTNPPTLAGPFTLDRRAGASYEENRFYSQAFLKTQDHVHALEALERILNSE